MKMANKKLLLTILCSTFFLFIMPNKVLSSLPEILDGKVLENIKNNKGIYKSPHKTYAVWAFKEGTTE